MTVYAITDTKKGSTGIAPTYLHTTPRDDATSGKLTGCRTNINMNVSLLYIVATVPAFTL